MNALKFILWLVWEFVQALYLLTMTVIVGILLYLPFLMIGFLFKPTPDNKQSERSVDLQLEGY